MPTVQPVMDRVITTAEPLLRLLHLVSPALPTGAFTYSQGLEWAVEAGWMRTAGDLERWLGDQLDNSLARLDLPLFARMYEAAAARDHEGMQRWIDWLVAGRETAELRAEEAQRGRALAELLVALDLADARPWQALLARSQAAGFAFAAAAWAIPPREAAIGYTWGWLENLVLAAVKLIPLGQSQGQRTLVRLVAQVPALVERALSVSEGEIGASSPALAIASSAHETQYTRLFRS